MRSRVHSSHLKICRSLRAASVTLPGSSIKLFKMAGSGQLLTVGVALGVLVPLIHMLSRLFTRILTLQAPTNPYQEFHEGLLATLTVGLAAIIGALALRVFRLDE